MTTDKLESRLRALLVEDESRLPKPERPSSLVAHVERVARIARRLALDEGQPCPEEAYLAGLLHDAGKLEGGAYHVGEVTEEEQSAAVARRLLGELGYPTEVVTRVCNAIHDLYRDDVEPSTLTAVVHDADNLDKLGPHGIANFFVKAGLRGRGLDQDLAMQLGVELTYARHAPATMLTEAGRTRAHALALQTESFVLQLLDALHSQLGWQLELRTLPFQDLEVAAVVPRGCACSAEVHCTVDSEPSLKCTMIRLEQTCSGCGARRTLSFCRPRPCR